jgi:sulfate adenylyltransferase
MSLLKTLAQRSARAVAGRMAAPVRQQRFAAPARVAARAFSVAPTYKYRTYDPYPVHGGELKERMVTDKATQDKLIASTKQSITLTDRQLCDVELLMNGAFSPLEGFMDEDVYHSCVDTMRLPGSNLLFGIPVVFDTNDDSIKVGDKLLLKSKAGENVAVMEVSSRYTPNKPKECKLVYGTSSLEHPGTLMVATERGKDYLGGKVHGLNIPKRPFPCKTPAQVGTRTI